MKPGPSGVKLLCCGITYQHQSGWLTPSLCLRVDLKPRFLPTPIARSVRALLGAIFRHRAFRAVGGLAHPAWVSTNPPSPLEFLCSTFLQHLRSTSLDLLPSPSGGLLLLLDPEPSPWPCLDPAASPMFSLAVSPLPLSVFLTISLSFPGVRNEHRVWFCTRFLPVKGKFCLPLLPKWTKPPC